MTHAATNTPWFALTNPAGIASPALLVYRERVEQNIEHLIDIAGGTDRLRPHIKTHKMPPIVALHVDRGISKIKCATIAEAEMAAGAGAADVLLAYQPVGPNVDRLFALAAAYPDTRFGCLVDNEATVQALEAAFYHRPFALNVWIDIDNGMGRSGIQPGTAAERLGRRLADSPTLTFAGLHVYDGQFGGLTIEERNARGLEAFAAVRAMIGRLQAEGLTIPNIVAGGSPTFPVHARQNDVDLSPGTYIFWDEGYGRRCPELPFVRAAAVLTRVVSKPAPNRLCLDLGHKAIASENPLDRRVFFPATPEAAFLSHSEEHLVIEVENGDQFAVGEALIGIPWHICPTVALHQEAVVIDGQGRVSDRWSVVARSRRLTF